MSIGMGGLFASAAGVPLAQISGSENDRTRIESSAKQRAAQSELKAEAAAGIGATDGENHETADRDADGRRLWEFGEHQHPAHSVAEGEIEPPHAPNTDDACGHGLDLTG